MMVTNEQGVVLQRVKETDGFTFRWPDGRDELYERLIEYKIINAPGGLGTGHIKLALGVRDAYGKSRRRILVFRDQITVLAEFVGADDYEKSRHVLWLLKKPESREDIHPDDDIPDDYRRFRCVRYDEFVQGPRARSGSAIIAHEEYHAIMVEAALVRESHLRAFSK